MAAPELFEREVSSKRAREEAPLGQEWARSAGPRLHDAPERAKEIRKEQRAALISGVTCHLEVEAWHACRLSSKAVMPTIKKLRKACRGSVKCGWQRLTRAQKHAICADTSAKTVMEECDGMMPAVEYQHGRAESGLIGLRAAASIFRQEVMPTALAAGTRARFHPLWKGFVTFAIAHGALREVMPASKDLVQAWAL